MQAMARDARNWVALAVLGLVVGLVGPFGTYPMGTLPRLVYWAMVVFGTAVIGTLCSGLLVRLLRPLVPPLVADILGGAIAGLPVTLVVLAINSVAFGPATHSIGVGTLVVSCSIITASVTLLVSLFARREAPELADRAAPRLLDRMPLPVRGRLLHLAVADHYVEVTTDRGKALLLMRLSDAIGEAAPVEGLQVHRSHWVALAAVRKATRKAGKPVVELETGTVVPISRTYLAEARAAGLISR